MFYTILDDFILYQYLTIKPSKYTNLELDLHKYFYSKTSIDPSYILIIKIEQTDFIFFFINQNNYFEAKSYLNSIRNQIKHKKVMIIRMDNILINLIFNLFPDLYIHDISLEINYIQGKYEISICFLKDLNVYHIAVGQNGIYIKAVNELFSKYISFYGIKTPLVIRCKKTD
jgi:hypothetical protein